MCVNGNNQLAANVSQRNISNAAVLVYQDENVKHEIARSQSKILLKTTKKSGNTITNTLFEIDTKNPDYEHLNHIVIEWSGDINNDNMEELLIQYELGNTIYKHLIGSDSNGNYYLIASDSLYWD